MAHKGSYAGLRFCPKCGVERLEFDRYRERSMQGKACDRAEYICALCGFGFQIGDSTRVALARQMFRQHRQLRVGKWQEGITAEAAEGWLRFTEAEHGRWQRRMERRGAQP